MIVCYNGSDFFLSWILRDANTFYLYVCFMFVTCCVSGGFTGDGYSVSSGQQTAGQIQDAGWNW